MKIENDIIYIDNVAFHRKSVISLSLKYHYKYKNWTFEDKEYSIGLQNNRPEFYFDGAHESYYLYEDDDKNYLYDKMSKEFLKESRPFTYNVTIYYGLVNQDNFSYELNFEDTSKKEDIDNVIKIKIDEILKDYSEKIFNGNSSDTNKKYID